ncbi:hypothetical protein [Sinorhizobium meliloti]|uniref:hypothetical protein n=2 Tax=Rhizobium meliloti TaxID=382 RepID=UPI000401D7BB|nr:hypothetical protein [Sinorhizobium meliloti]
MLHGMDINVGSSVPGAFGNAGVGKLVHDYTFPEEEQRLDLLRNIAIICAGAAADARTMNRNINEALENQPGDLAVAKAELAASPLLAGAESEEINFVLQTGLANAERLLAEPDIWDAVVKIAQACLANDGKLSKEEIEALLT